jgi:hypothetical protein
MTPKRLRLLVFQEAPGLWVVRGLEHDVGAEACTIGEAIRAAVRFVQAHTAFEIRRDHLPLAAFPSSAKKFWNAYATGTQLSLARLGVTVPPEWDVQVAFAPCCPLDERPMAGHRPAARAGLSPVA